MVPDFFSPESVALYTPRAGEKVTRGNSFVNTWVIIVFIILFFTLFAMQYFIAIAMLFATLFPLPVLG